MPNWCANSLKLVATTAESEKKLAEIVSELERAKCAGESAEIFKLIKPIPQALLDTVAGFRGHGTPEQAALEIEQAANLKKYGYKDWYSFCIGEWGTKWDMNNQYEDEPYTIEGNRVTMVFDTAWSPPMEIYYALEEMGFEVEATYVEQGVGYIGYYSNGEDHCEEMNQFYPEPSDDPDMEDSAMDEITLKIYNYFEKSGFTHSPSNLGG
jgi:hypothetical protein